MNKPGPCAPCPWTKKGTPDITPELRRLAENGSWFCCHGRGGGTCIGAYNVYQAAKKKEAV